MEYSAAPSCFDVLIGVRLGRCRAGLRGPELQNRARLPAATAIATTMLGLERADTCAHTTYSPGLL